MRKLYILTLLLLLSLTGATAFGQILSTPGHITNDTRFHSMQGQRSGVAACGPDTLLYAQAKGNGLRGITLNNSTSANKLAQYFDAPQTVTVHGFDFYAWSPATANPSNNPVTLTCRLYNVGPDSLPLGAAIASATVVVDTVFGGGQLSALRKSINFATPVTRNQPFLLSVETSSNTSVAMVTTDWATADGAGEWLADVSIGANWSRSYAINVGGVPFDADVVIEPYVTYNLTAAFNSSSACLPGPATLTFTNNSSGAMENRMYNQAAFLGLTRLSYTWDFGDGSPQVNAIDTTHIYTTGGSYTVSLNDTLFGWTTTCTADTSFTLGAAPVANFSATVTSPLNYQFTDLTPGASSWSWNFGDGIGISNNQNPVYNYASTGTYVVTLIVSNGCGADTVTQTITVACPVPTGGFTFTTSLLDANFTSNTPLAVTYVWDFGDGGTATSQNPTHTYSSPGTYTVCLIATNSCGSDTTCSAITVSCPGPGADFSTNINQGTVVFTDNSTNGPTSWAWDFGDGNTSTSQNPTHTYTTSGMYTVTLVVVNACGADTFSQTVNVVIIGLEDGIAPHFNLFPNPADQTVNVQWEGGNGAQTLLQLTDLTGRELMRQTVGGQQATLQIGTLAPGVYMLAVTQNGQRMVQRVQVQH